MACYSIVYPDYRGRFYLSLTHSRPVMRELLFVVINNPSLEPLFHGVESSWPRLPRLLDVAALLSPSTLLGDLVGCSCNRQGGLTPY